MPLESTPISALTTKIPAIVIASEASRKGHPASPPIVPGSKARVRLSQVVSRKPPSPSAAATTASKTAPTITSSSVAAASQATMAGVPRDIVESNQ